MAYTPSQNIRFVLGANGENEGILTEEEILHAMELYPQSWRLAAAAIAERFAAVATQRRRPVSFTAVGDMAVSWSDDVAKWQSIAAKLKAEHIAEEDDRNRPMGMQVRSMAYKNDPEPPEFTVNRTRYGGLKR